jgi:histidinol phosphatase-like enzyme
MLRTPRAAVGSNADAPVDQALVAAAERSGIEVALCEHGGGPPTCWCRPPLPGLVVRWLRARGIDARRSTFVGTSRAHRTLAEGLGMRFTAG